jgi:FkbM family methyltransferase
MGAINSTTSLFFKAFRYGVGFRSIYLAFLSSGLTKMGDYRKKLKNKWIKSITSMAKNGQVAMNVKLSQKKVTFHMREGNISDYLVGGEMVDGAYRIPLGVTIKPTAIIDGGANIGMFSVVGNAYFPDLPVICYEPDKENLIQLRKNLEQNNINAKVVPKALWSSEETLYYHPSMSYSGTVTREPSPFPMECCVPEIPEGCWLKLDIEGSEYEVLPVVLNGKTRPNLISMEIHYFNESGQILIDLLEKSNYKIYGDYSAHNTCVNIMAVLNNTN